MKEQRPYPKIMDNLRAVIFAMLCFLAAFAYTGWKEVTHAMTQAQRRGWFIFAVLFFIGALAWILKPCWEGMFQH